MKKLALAILVLGLGSMASAQVRSGTVEIEPFGGYLWGGHFARGTTALFDTRVEVDDRPTYGLRLGYNVTSKFEFEVQASRTDTHFLTPETDIFGTQRRLGDLRIDYLLGYMTFNLGHRRAVPYFTLGGGVARLDPVVPGKPARSTTRGTGSIGAGFKVFFNPHFGARLDGRYLATYLTRDRRCDDRRFRDCDSRRSLTNGTVTGGFLFAF